MEFSVIETGLLSRLGALSLFVVFPGVAEVSLLGLFAGVEDSPASAAGLICNEPLDRLLSVGFLLGEVDGRE